MSLVPLISLFFLIAVSVASAQQQERKLIDRIMKPDETLTFDPSQHAIGSLLSYGTGATRTKDFYFDQKVRSSNFQTRGFYGNKTAYDSETKFAAKDANTRGRYVIPNAEKKADTKTMTTKDLRDGDKSVTTQAVHDGKRPYLGPESKKLSNAVDAKTLADWRSAETVSMSGNTVERYSNLKQLTIDDVRELLNKNK